LAHLSFPVASSTLSDPTRLTQRREMAEIVEAQDGLPVEVTIDSQEQSCVDSSILPGSSSEQYRIEMERLPRVADKVPIQVWFVMLISTSERFAFYGLQAPFRKPWCRAHSTQRSG